MIPQPSLDLETIARVGRLWRLRLVTLYPALLPAGSPDRSLARGVAGTEDGRLILVERLSPAMAPRKMAIATLLQALQDRGLRGVSPYLPTGDGQQVVPLGGDYWQISPYLEGAALPRPGWVWDAWRGSALAEWLCRLQAASRLVRLPAEPPYSLAGFVQDLLDQLRTHRPALAGALAATVEPLLAEWLPPEGALATGFCHGDPHPLNVIWAPEDRAIAAVIDWEFCGTKPAAYDAALIIGCVGIEDPEALSGPFVEALLRGLRSGEHPAGFEAALWALVLAVRFAWLSDWLRRGDEEMVGLEHDYIHLLVDHRAALESAWAAA